MRDLGLKTLSDPFLAYVAAQASHPVKAKLLSMRLQLKLMREGENLPPLKFMEMCFVVQWLELCAAGERS